MNDNNDFENKFDDFVDYSDVEELSLWERYRDIIINPSKVFKSIKVYPKQLIPLLFIVIGAFLAGIMTLDKATFIDNSIRAAENSGQFIPERDTLSTYYYMTLAFIPLFPLIMLTFKSFMVNGLSIVIGGQGEAKEAISLLLHAYTPVILGQIVLGIISFAFNLEPIQTNLAVILPNSMSNNFLYTFLSQIDIFVIWYQILAIIGVSYVYEISKKKALFPVLAPWITWIILLSGLSTIMTGLNM